MRDFAENKTASKENSRQHSVEWIRALISSWVNFILHDMAPMLHGNWVLHTFTTNEMIVDARLLRRDSRFHAVLCVMM